MELTAATATVRPAPTPIREQKDLRQDIYVHPFITSKIER